jgi:hypothetical protein
MPCRALVVRAVVVIVRRLFAVAEPAPGIRVDVLGAIGAAIDGISRSMSVVGETVTVRPELVAARPHVSQ